MSLVSPVFEQHYEDYLRQMADLDLMSLGPAIGGQADREPDGPVVGIPYFGGTYRVSASGITGPDGRRPGYDTCIILSRHLIMAPDAPGQGDSAPAGEWKGFRDLKEAGPLTVYFKDNVEGAIANVLSGRLPDAVNITETLGARTPDMDIRYDLALEIPALPKVPMLLLFNDAEEEFPASCSVLFRPGVDAWLDAECIAMIGYRLAVLVRRAMS
ncbi:MAG: DUF3786 domain-containing protein [Desulfobacter sp.]